MDAGDRWVMWRLVRRGPRLDRLMLAASRAADHTVLWLILAAIMTVAGGDRGRAAAKRGLLAMALASGIVNGPVKLLVHRPRPPAGCVC